MDDNVSCGLSAPEGAGGADLKLVDWRPVSQLKVKETKVMKPRFPVIDMHNHLGRLVDTGKYLEEMDEAGVWRCVSLDGHSKDDFYRKHLEVSRGCSPERFTVFFHPDFLRIDEPDFGHREAARLEEAVGSGCRGVKVFKQLGLEYRDASGALIAIDDPRLDPIWTKCGELGIPVLIHTGDPEAFFIPVDRYNERYDELAAHPEWSFADRRRFPSKEALLGQRNRMIARHPETTYICPHMANLPEDLGRVGMWLDTYSNIVVDISARISELGRQPYTARKFLIRYQDRILFGTDTEPDAEAYRVYYRFLETDDEYIDPGAGHHMQGRWAIYGISLPDDVLRKLYHGNALRILNACEEKRVKSLSL